ncbi:MAG TPA: ABC transporter permease [Burkholderiaceae bacterium]|nr:ABC transporter permease [Burkholderiaceae bacterium]
MMPVTPAAPNPDASFRVLTRGIRQWLAGWWRVIHLGALLLVLALSPSTYGVANQRALARHIYLGTAPSLLWFGVLSALISTILIRIVLVTALSYGLSQYALEMVVRVLVLELIPITAALFTALRCTIPYAVEVGALLHDGRGDDERLLCNEVLPRVTAGVFCALLLAAVSCVVALVIAYLSVYGFTTSGFAAYTHTVGRVFNPAVSSIFGMKIMLLAIAVALMPMAAVLDHGPVGGHRTSAELRGLVRMFVVILLIEAASLVGNYY